MRIGIYGYGNLGRGVEAAVRQNDDMELVAVFTRRNPETVKLQTEGVKVYPAAEAANHADEIDVLVLCKRSYRFDFLWLGPRYVLFESSLCQCSFATG